jgi:hypothetical protein
MRSRWRKLLVAVCLAALLTEGIPGCAPAATPTQTGWPRPVTPTQIVLEPTPDRPVPLDHYPFFAPEHLIITGPKGQIVEVIEVVSDIADLKAVCSSLGVQIEETFSALPQLKREERLELDFLEELLNACLRKPSKACFGLPQYEALLHAEKPSLPQLYDWVMDLYRITGPDRLDELQVTQLVAAVNCVSEKMYGLTVLAEPVYRTGRFPPTGNPWIGEGSPWIGEGSPHGSPAEVNDDFWSQWAFRDGGPGQEPVGIGLVTVVQDGSYARTVPRYEGERIRVGVFDTSPFAEPGPKSIDWVTPTLELRVRHPEVAVTWPDIKMPIAPPSIDEHGLFVAGLIHAVAPRSEIHLYRVLDEFRRGDLWTLNSALHEFISSTLAAGAKPSGAVINLSLGGHPPQDYERRLAQLVREEVWPAEQVSRITRLLLAEVTSLKTLLSAAYGHGIVVVAAAGNDSYGQEVIAGPQIPASFSEFIAVGSTGIQGNRACFSNWGDAAAPGGDGNATTCQPMVDQCSDGCEYGLISLVPISNDFPMGYAYWAGTSFSAPLVSGLAALVLEKEGGKVSPEEVRTKITGSATESAGWDLPGAPPGRPPPGVINVPMTLRQ